MPLSTIAKRLIPEGYQALHNAGYLNDELKITESGRTALTHLALVEFEDELITKAKAKIAEAKAKKEVDEATG